MYESWIYKNLRIFSSDNYVLHSNNEDLFVYILNKFLIIYSSNEIKQVICNT